MITLIPQRTLTTLLTALLTLCLSSASIADSNSKPDDGLGWQLALSVGSGQRSNPLANSDNIDRWWLVDIAWFGKRAFFDNGDFGFALHDGENTTLNWVTRFNTERVFFSKLHNNILLRDNIGFNAGPSVDEPDADPEPFEIPDRDYALETGAELLMDGNLGYLHAQAMVDVSNTHQGGELWLNIGQDYVLGRWHIQPSITLAWKSKKLNDYYYGVRASEVQGGLTEYQARDGINVSAKLAAAYYISQHWKAFVMADYEQLNSEAADSPLLEKDHISSYFAGVSYRF